MDVISSPSMLQTERRPAKYLRRFPGYGAGMAIRSTAPEETSSGYDAARWMFALAFSLLVSHELDAMIRAEWELLPGLETLSPDLAPDVFNLLHVPLVAAAVWLVTSPNGRTRRLTMIVCESLFVGHAIAHTLVRGAERYQFEPPVETMTVYGAAVVSAIHLSLLWLDSRRVRPDSIRPSPQVR